jgi:cbb3-type cytochrome oxidase maturation protein
MAGVSVGFVFWAIKSGQFQEDDRVKRKPLEEDEEIDF